jgi:ubiquinone/menaquinone biosynthesis C-methylase UbiE
LKCYGRDTSEGMLAQAERKVPEAKFNLASFYELPFQDESFDYVVETNAVSGVEIEVEQVLREMIRVCKVGGEIRIADYSKAPRLTPVTRLIEWILIFVGDYAYDYMKAFNDFGYHPECEILGWRGLYQSIRIHKVC